MTHLRKVELVGKPRVAQADQAHAHHSANSHGLESRALVHAARARALSISRAHITGIATMLRYMAAKHDTAAVTNGLIPAGVLSRIAR